MKEQITRFFGKAAFKLKEHSPELLLVGGTVAVVAGVILACKSTIKAQDILAEHQEVSEDIAKAAELEGEDKYPEEDQKADKMVLLGQTVGQMALNYALPVGLITIGIGCFFGAYGITHGRLVNAVGALELLTNEFKEYRARVREEVGKDCEEELYYNFRKLDTSTDRPDGTGKIEDVEMIEEGLDRISQYARFFDEANPEWCKDPNANYTFLRARQNWANQKLKAQGYLFLNDVYDMLHMPPSEAGCYVGWIWSEDAYIDFGIYNARNAAFSEGWERSVLLDFNVDGVISTKLDGLVRSGRIG